MLALLASTSALPAGKAAGKAAGKGAGAPGATKNPAASALGKLRSDMMKWYCAGGQHDDIPPCKTFSFMTKMRATSSAEEKKKLLTARQEAMKKLSPEERKKSALEAKAGYITMYKEYCEKTDIPNKNPDVCTNTLLKNLYGKKM